MAEGGAAKRRQQRDIARAAYMKARGIVRTTGVCPVCYRIVAVDSTKSRYTHICRW